jgi:hypothetical protein
MSRTAYIALAVLIVGSAMFLVLSSSEEPPSATQKLIQLSSVDHVTAKSVFPGEIVCFVPPELDPFAFVAVNFRGKRATDWYDYDSNNEWFVIEITNKDNAAKIMKVDRRKVEPDLKDTVCGDNLVVSTRISDGKILLSVSAGRQSKTP